MCRWGEYLSAQNHISLLGGIQLLEHYTIWGLLRCVRVSSKDLAALTQDLHLTQAAAAKQDSWGCLRKAEHPCEPCACLAVLRIEDQTCNKCSTFHMSAWERWPALQRARLKSEIEFAVPFSKRSFYRKWQACLWPGNLKSEVFCGVLV